MQGFGEGMGKLYRTANGLYSLEVADVSGLIKCIAVWVWFDLVVS